MREFNKFRFRSQALLMALAAVFPLTTLAAGAAKVDFSVGTVNVVAVGGATRPASKGTELQSGETLVTGEGGRAQLRFSDGGMVSLQPGSEYRIDDYRFSGSQDGAERGFFSLVKGGLRTITGQIGRNDKAAYRVKTNVATIGIRGTEFTVAYTGADTIAVATGEGAIEVCNSAGCAILPSGSSAIVSGPDTRIERSEVRPRLDPAQPEDTRLAVFSSSESRQEDGRITPVSMPLRSGTGYAVAFAYRIVESGNHEISRVASSPVTFNDYSAMQSFVNDVDTLAIGTMAGSFSVDGVIGWGRWSSGTVTSTGATAIADLHYVVGTPTSLAGLTGTANFSAFGGTNATHRDDATGVVTLGGVATGSMTVSFGGAAQIDTLSLTVPINGQEININQTNIGVTDGTFNFIGSTMAASLAGLFTGTNASFAGLTYAIPGTSAGLSGDSVTGSVVFNR